MHIERVSTALGSLSTMQAGSGEPLVLLHGLGGTKSSFRPTLDALAPRYRVIAVDLPGFGASAKPLPGGYDAAFFTRWIIALLDALELRTCHLTGHSLGGRVALEVGLRHPDRVRSLILLTPSLPWLRERSWARYLRLLRPELGLLQPTPQHLTGAIVRRLVPGANGGYTAARVDEFLRSYLTARGRVAFYAAARNIYLEEPEAFWRRLPALRPESLFIWGRQDGLVPIGFKPHVRRALPHAEHVEIDSGHLVQLERPVETHAAMERFLAAARNPAPQVG